MTRQWWVAGPASVLRDTCDGLAACGDAQLHQGTIFCQLESWYPLVASACDDPSFAVGWLPRAACAAICCISCSDGGSMRHPRQSMPRQSCTPVCPPLCLPRLLCRSTAQCREGSWWCTAAQLSSCWWSAPSLCRGTTGWACAGTTAACHTRRSRAPQWDLTPATPGPTHTGGQPVWLQRVRLQQLSTLCHTSTHKCAFNRSNQASNTIQPMDDNSHSRLLLWSSLPALGASAASSS
jgi:hypothetical protein